MLHNTVKRTCSDQTSDSLSCPQEALLLEPLLGFLVLQARIKAIKDYCYINKVKPGIYIVTLTRIVHEQHRLQY
jgi:hypothetical protein